MNYRKLHRVCSRGALLLLCMIAGCKTIEPPEKEGEVIGQLAARTAPAPVPTPTSPELKAEIPNQVDLTDGLSEDEAVAIALWNNPDFQATMAQLGVSRGDIIQSGLLTNPLFSTFLPAGPKQWEWTLTMPLEALVLRPRRLAVTESDYERLGQSLVQNGLDQARNARLAFADLLFAIERSALAEESVGLRKQIAELSDKQLESGDISKLENTTARITYLQSKADAAGLRQAIPLATNQLKRVLGITFVEAKITPVPCEVRTVIGLQAEALIKEALAARPDLRAAELAIANAKARVDLARISWLQVSGLLDNNSDGEEGYEAGPGVLLSVPIFDRNQGGLSSAHALVEQRIREHKTLKQQAAFEIKRALVQIQQAGESLEILRTEVLPSLKEALDLANKAFQKGGASYFLVLQTTSQYLDGRARELDLVLSLRRALAELERSVGRRLDTLPFSVQPAPVTELP